MSYDPIDQEYLTNKLTSNYANLVDKIQGSSGGNRGVANASMIAAMNNLYDAYGDTAIKSKGYNRDMLSKTLEFNRATSQANAQMRMAADQYNANAEDRMVATNAANRAARRNAIREQIAGLGENLGAIGTEQRWMDLAPKLFRGYKSNGDKEDSKSNSTSDKEDSTSKAPARAWSKRNRKTNTVIEANGGYLDNNIFKGGGPLGTNSGKYGSEITEEQRRQNRERILNWPRDLYNFVTTIPEAVGSLFNGGAPLSGSSLGGGKGGGGGAASKFRKEDKIEDWFKNDTIYVPITETFNDAFANARKNGDKTFTFDNKEYTTELGGDEKSVKAGEARTRAVGLFPFVKKRRVSVNEKNKSFNRKGWTKED